jgi:hypothetical protein
MAPSSQPSPGRVLRTAEEAEDGALHERDRLPGDVALPAARVR